MSQSALAENLAFFLGNMTIIFFCFEPHKACLLCFFFSFKFSYQLTNSQIYLFFHSFITHIDVILALSGTSYIQMGKFLLPFLNALHCWFINIELMVKSTIIHTWMKFIPHIYFLCKAHHSFLALVDTGQCLCTIL